MAAFGLNEDAGTRHFISSGLNEGRLVDDFDAQQYVDNYFDLQQAFGDDLVSATQHYILTGVHEGRTDEIF